MRRADSAASLTRYQTRLGRSLALPWFRLTLAALLAVGLGAWLAAPSFLAPLAAQEETNPTLELTPETPATAAPAASAKPRTILDTLKDGGIIGATIILLSIVAVGFIVEHAISITKERLMPAAVLDQVEELVAGGDLPAAIQCCEDPRNYSLASEVLLAGLERYQTSEFGFADYKSAVEEAGEDFTAGLYRKTDVLAVIGAIAPMLGLLGTVAGMIGAFNTIAATEGAARPAALAGDIGKALITTLLGLLVAIPAMIAFSFFRNKIDTLVSECGKRVERVLMPLSRKR